MFLKSIQGIWKKPVPKDLTVGFSALSQSVRFVHVALVKCGTWKQAQMLQEKHQQISSSLKTTWIEILEWNKRWGIWNFLAAGHAQGGLLLQSGYLIFIWRLAQSGEITFFVRFLYTSRNISSSFFQTTKHIKNKRHSRILLSTTSLVWELDAVCSPDTLLHHLHLGIWCWTLWWCSFWAVGLETRDCNVFYGLKGWLWKCCTWFIGEMLYLLTFLNFFVNDWRIKMISWNMWVWATGLLCSRVWKRVG